MNLNELTLGQIKELKSMFGGGDCQVSNTHPDTGKKVIIRTYSAGVHYGTLSSKKDGEVILKDAIRIYYWAGACSLSQLSVDGTNDPSSCKFAVPVDVITLQWIEILPCTEAAQKSIEGTATWKK